MASDTSSMQRTVRRSLRKKKPGRLIVIGFLVVLLAIVGIYYATQYPEDRDYAEYPLKYQELIEQYAKEYSLESAHIAAVVMCESSFRAEAVSSVGALGLMQIMPDTGGWIAGKLDERDTFVPESLKDPATNLRYGCWYLKWLLDRFEGDKQLVTCAYHAGQGSVDKWLSDSAYSADGVSLDTIPSKVTRNYVEKVLSAYEKYKKLYTFADEAG